MALSLIQYTEKVVGAGSPLYSDVINRPLGEALSQSGYLGDGSDFAGFAKTVHTHDASAIVSGILGVARGGIGVATVAVGALLLGAGAGAMTPLGAGVAGHYVRDSGAAWTSSALLWADVTSTPTTIAGYGITDAYTKTQADARYAFVAGPFPWADVTGQPTTIAGYGITDAYTKTQGDARYVQSVTGTTGRITIGGTATGPIIDIASTYIGQASITTLGTVGTGVWHGSIVDPTYGGTGVNNGASLITVAGNFTTVGAFALTLTTTGATSVTLPTSGTLVNTAGNVATATALATPRAINGIAFNGTIDITVPAAAGTLTGTTLASNVVASSLTSTGTLTSLTVSGTSALQAVTATSATITQSGANPSLVLARTGAVNNPSYTIVVEEAGNRFIVGRTGIANDFVLAGGVATFAGDVAVSSTASLGVAWGAVARLRWDGISALEATNTAVNAYIDFGAKNIRAHGTMTADSGLTVSAGANSLVGTVALGSTLTMGRATYQQGTLTAGVTNTGTTQISSATGVNFMLVFGDNGTNGWFDLVTWIAGAGPAVLASTNAYGTPPTRTYSNSGSSTLLLQVSSITGGTYNIRVIPTTIT